MLARFFTDHPRSVGESYIQHAGVASRVGFALIGGGLACLVHAAVPALFVRTGSDTVKRLHARLIRRAPAAPGAAETHEWQHGYVI